MVGVVTRLSKTLFRCLSVVLLCAASASAEKVGVLLPLSGDLALIGTKIRQGIEVAAAKSSHEVIFEDTGYVTSRGLSALEKLIRVDKVRYIIGPLGPKQTLAVAPRAAKMEVVQVAISLCDRRYSQYPSLFCTYPSLLEQVSPLFKRFGGEEKLISNLAVLVEQSEIGNGYLDLIKNFADEAGIEIVVAEKYTEIAELRSILTRIRGRDPDLLVVSGSNPKNVVESLVQAAELGVKPRYRWYLSEQDKALFSKHKDLMEGVYLESIPLDLKPEFVTKVRDRFEAEADLYHGLGYDAAHTLFKAIDSGADVVDYLIDETFAESSIPGFDFLDNRTVAMSLVPSMFRDGEQERLE